MQDELVRIVNPNSTTGYTTTRRSWMKPEDVEFDETIPEPAEDPKPTNKRKSKK